MIMFLIVVNLTQSRLSALHTNVNNYAISNESKVLAKIRITCNVK